jgi:hypothetical protein
MTEERPRVDALLLAELIDSVPGRVRKRLDKDPEAALAWPWRQESGVWSVACGEETVKLQTQRGVVRSRTDVACSCLLSPKCFHILACVSLLSSAEPDIELAEAEDPSALGEAEMQSGGEEFVRPEQQEAARLAHSAASSLLAVGARQAGLLLQSALLRAGHSCRSVGLVNLGNTILRIVESVQRLRGNADTADGPQFVQDLATAIEIAYTILNALTVPRWKIGQARRSFERVEIRKLEGICAEPILTLSGYAGICVYLHETNDKRPSGQPYDLYTINELRTGDSQLVRQAYRGGIELGSLSMAASEICRRKLSVQGATASIDGRLGKGRTSRWVAMGPEQNPIRFSDGRFGLPLDEQIEHVFRGARMTPDQRRAGWDLIAFDATVIGPDGSGLVVHVPAMDSPCHLSIPIDVPELPYRENLQFLARCPKLRMRCLGRLKLQSAGEVDLLAVADRMEEAVASVNHPDQRHPRFVFPESWGGLCNVGIDILQRHYLNGIERWSEDVVLAIDDGSVSAVDDGLAAVRRRLIGLGLGGRDAVPAASSSAHQRDLYRLKRGYQLTAAQLLEDLAMAASQHRGTVLARGTERRRESASLQDVFLACHVYTREASLQFQRACWLNQVEVPARDSA